MCVQRGHCCVSHRSTHATWPLACTCKSDDVIELITPPTPWVWVGQNQLMMSHLPCLAVSMTHTRRQTDKHVLIATVCHLTRQSKMMAGMTKKRLVGFSKTQKAPKNTVNIMCSLTRGVVRSPTVSWGWLPVGWATTADVYKYRERQWRISVYITPQVTRKIVHANTNECNVMNEFIGQGKRLITEITTPDFF